MALVLTVEDGTGLANANCYASVATGDAYHEGHLYASAWDDAATALKEKALVMATHLIDEFFQFNGVKRRSSQARQWPRQDCPDPDNDSAPSVLSVRHGAFLPEDKVPAAVVHATCELARELLKADRTGDPDGEGLRSLALEGAMNIEFDKDDRRKALSLRVQVMLSKYGAFQSGQSGVARLVRT